MREYETFFFLIWCSCYLTLLKILQYNINTSFFTIMHSVFITEIQWSSEDHCCNHILWSGWDCSQKRIAAYFDIDLNQITFNRLDFKFVYFLFVFAFLLLLFSFLSHFIYLFIFVGWGYVSIIIYVLVFL